MESYVERLDMNNEFLDLINYSFCVSKVVSNPKVFHFFFFTYHKTGFGNEISTISVHREIVKMNISECSFDSHHIQNIYINYYFLQV